MILRIVRLALALAIACVMLAAPAAARTRVAPYIGVEQVLDVPLAGEGDVLTYTALAAGIDASASGRRVEGTASYRYERRVSWNDRRLDGDVHSGLARGDVALVPGLLTLQAGGIAMRAHTDVQGPAPDTISGGRDTATQIYAGFGGPSLATRVGALDLTASYRFGIVKVEDGFGYPALANGGRRLDPYGNSTSHNLSASVGMSPRMLPIGWTVSAGYEREQASPLSQRYRNEFLRGDVIVPVSPTVALTAGIGHEAITASQAAVRLDPDGIPEFDRRGRLIANDVAPRLTGYYFSGLLYDAGLTWRPSRRTTLVANVGRRYGDFALTGAFRHRTGPTSGFQVSVHNGLDSFGRSLNRTLSSMPTRFVVPRTGLSDRFDGCVFGDRGAGACFGNALQSLDTANYRARGVTGIYSAARGHVSVGVGASYDEHRYVAPKTAGSFALDGINDRSWSLQANLGFGLDPGSSVQNQLYVTRYASGFSDAPASTTVGVTTTYLKQFTDRLSGNAGVGFYAADRRRERAGAAAQLLLGLRYQF